MKKFSLLSTALLLAGCVYPFSVELEDITEQSLVADANILLGSTSTIKLSYLQSLQVGQSAVSAGRPSAEVYLEDGSGHRYTATGSYGNYTIPAFVPSQDNSYRLTILCDGKTFRSEWIEPVAAPRITDLSFGADETQVHLLLSLEDDGSGSGYAGATLDEIWNFHADFLKELSYDPKSNTVSVIMNPDDSVYWCWRKYSSNSQVIIDYSSLGGKVNNFVVGSFPRSNNRNHREYHARVKLWNLTPEQYQYRKMLEENASIGGNLFSPEPGEVRGNVFCEEDPAVKVYGYVNISRVTTRELVLDDRYSRWKVPYTSLSEIPEENWLEMYGLGYTPVTLITNENMEYVPGWGLGRCYDCTLAGGTLEKPDFD
mgnify:CR=1 FL=1